jgi:hypothetical protein
MIHTNQLMSWIFYTSYSNAELLIMLFLLISVLVGIMSIQSKINQFRSRCMFMRALESYAQGRTTKASRELDIADILNCRPGPKYGYFDQKLACKMLILKYRMTSYYCDDDRLMSYAYNLDPSNSEAAVFRITGRLRKFCLTQD